MYKIHSLQKANSEWWEIKITGPNNISIPVKKWGPNVDEVVVREWAQEWCDKRNRPQTQLYRKLNEAMAEKAKGRS